MALAPYHRRVTGRATPARQARAGRGDRGQDRAGRAARYRTTRRSAATGLRSSRTSRTSSRGPGGRAATVEALTLMLQAGVGRPGHPPDDLPRARGPAGRGGPRMLPGATPPLAWPYFYWRGPDLSCLSDPLTRREDSRRRDPIPARLRNSRFCMHLAAGACVPVRGRGAAEEAEWASCGAGEEVAASLGYASRTGRPGLRVPGVGDYLGGHAARQDLTERTLVSSAGRNDRPGMPSRKSGRRPGHAVPAFRSLVKPMGV